MSARALLVSADPGLIGPVREVIASVSGLEEEVVPRMADALARLRQAPAAVVLVHLAAADTAEVQNVLQHVAGTGAPTATIVLADAYRAEQALYLLRKGAADYLSRPLDLSRLAYLVDVLTVRARYLARSEAAASSAVAAEQLGELGKFLYPRGGSMGRVMEQVRTVAPQDTTVLLGGETGTGKTCLARLIHELSPRRREPFLVVNCASLAHHLIESELFGHSRGAFTGADRAREGKFTAVGKGTLLLDEIDALPLNLQAKLLRVVEERVFEPVGSNELLPARARLVVASNRDLRAEAGAGRFRSDLYYRLNVVAFYLPPLRERRELIAALAREFVTEFAARSGRPVAGITPQALRLLEAHDWPGNIRELRNAIERAVVLCPGPEVDVEDLPATLAAAGGDEPEVVMPTAVVGPTTGTLGEAKEVAEMSRILEALRRHKNNRLRAAAELGISRMTLYKKLHRYGLMSATG
jgi:DNA-binding NtrC family response regulator